MPIPLIGGAISAIGSLFKKKSNLTSTRPALMASTQLEATATKKPSLFARLFNTKKNKEYKAQIATQVEQEQVLQQTQQEQASRIGGAATSVTQILLYVGAGLMVLISLFFVFGKGRK